MSINWVMLDEAHKFVPLPGEKVLFTSPPRTSLSLDTSNAYPGKEPLSINCNSGTAFLTNQRLVYLPMNPTLQFKSFSAPISNLQDTRVAAPFFGPNAWLAVLQPVNGGGIPPHHAFVKLKMTFKEGGAFDLSSTYERIKETLSHASEVARENGRPVDLSTVDLEQLPAYEEVAAAIPATASMTTSTTHIQRPTPISSTGAPRLPRRDNVIADSSRNQKEPTNPEPAEQLPPPNEPPPGYDEAQQSSVAESLEESIRRSQ